MTTQTFVLRPLDGSVAIVTRASRGIGAAVARALAEAGAAVVLAARDDAALAQVAEGITAAGGGALVVPTDVSRNLAVLGPCRLHHRDHDRRRRWQAGWRPAVCSEAAGNQGRLSPLRTRNSCTCSSRVSVTSRPRTDASGPRPPSVCARPGLPA
jgi:hypothetical protein